MKPRGLTSISERHGDERALRWTTWQNTYTDDTSDIPEIHWNTRHCLRNVVKKGWVNQSSLISKRHGLIALHEEDDGFCRHLRLLHLLLWPHQECLSGDMWGLDNCMIEFRQLLIIRSCRWVTSELPVWRTTANFAKATFEALKARKISVGRFVSKRTGGNKENIWWNVELAFFCFDFAIWRGHLWLLDTRSMEAY